jgi:hypothetical protein
MSPFMIYLVMPFFKLHLNVFLYMCVRPQNAAPVGPIKGTSQGGGFLGFFHKPVRHRSLTLRFELFQFWLRIRGNI